LKEDLLAGGDISGRPGMVRSDIGSVLRAVAMEAIKRGWLWLSGRRHGHRRDADRDMP